jgi:hypothetical protein
VGAAPKPVEGAAPKGELANPANDTNAVREVSELSWGNGRGDSRGKTLRELCASVRDTAEGRGQFFVRAFQKLPRYRTKAPLIPAP